MKILNIKIKNKNLLNLIRELCEDLNCKMLNIHWKNEHNGLIYNYEPYIIDGFHISIDIESIDEEHLRFLKYLLNKKIDEICILNQIYIKSNSEMLNFN